MNTIRNDGFVDADEGTAFDVGLRQDDGDRPFSRQLPVFNWFYPFDAEPRASQKGLAALANVDWDSIRRISLYFHVPFCETICTFCPFTRGRYRTDQDIDAYVEALLREIQLKHPFIGRLRADSIFIGGGTPSILSPAQISRLGEYIHTYFDTNYLREFAVEVEVKSATYETLTAFRRIGVNRISFGVQTFSKRHRAAFGLDAEISQIVRVADWVNTIFPYTNVDIIYGIAGQGVDDVLQDADSAIELATTTIDFYPLNNVAAQPRMHRAFRSEGLERPTAAQRLQHRRSLRDHMLARRYARINGYGYALRRGGADEMIQSSPNFLYHDILYGYGDDAIVGYGASAVSQVPGYNFYNSAARTQYRTMLAEQNALPYAAYRTTGSSEKGIVTFPYRGALVKSRIPWASVSHETLDSLDRLVRAGLVREKKDTFEVTETGWLYYVNLMYFLMPSDGKRRMSKQISDRIAAGHEYESTAL
jgi:anaerobilin synthase